MMKYNDRRLAGFWGLLLLLGTTAVHGQSDQGASDDLPLFYNEVRTYVNPVLPGDHPDPTLLKVGDDFYHCGSSFHFTPYLPVYHSRDLVHWEVIGRVVPPSEAGFVTDRPSAGIWQGAITRFYGSYWIYFSAGGQWFCKAETPYGPWSAPVKVRTNAVTGNLGYDNSIFVDDDGKPYMVIKNGQKVNRLQALGRDGQLTDTVINLDWINAHLQYSWAEGPVMCKRNGYYYYFPAGDVSGGQYVLRSRSLTGDSTKWERLGDFFKPVTDDAARFRRPNHISAPVQLADGSWWTIGQSYEKVEGDDWSGMGRQTSLYPVTWEGDRPWGMAPVSGPVERPDLPGGGILWRSVHTDYFDTDTLGLWWHFLSRAAAGEYSLTARRGWVRLMPDSGRTHLVQKETDHYYSAVTRVDMDAADTADKAGIYLSNGNQKVVVRLYTGFDGGKKIFLRLDTAVRSVANPAAGPVWLKLERAGHMLTGYYSSDGRAWVSLGAPVSAVALDREQPNWNSWVGTSVGLFAEGRPADFDMFVCKDGFSPLMAAGYHNFYGIETAGSGAVTNTSSYGGWFMISGVELGKGAAQVKVLIDGVPGVAGSGTTVTARGRMLEIWLDDLKTGKMIARVPVTASAGGGDRWVRGAVTGKDISGTHDVFVKFPPGSDHEMYVRQLIFTGNK
jgi:beta-xylosidase